MKKNPESKKHAEHLKLTGAAIFASSALATVLLLFISYYYKLEVLRAAGLYYLVLTGLLLAVRQMIELRYELALRIEEESAADSAQGAGDTGPPENKQSAGPDRGNKKNKDADSGNTEPEDNIESRDEEPADSVETGREEIRDFGSGYLIYLNASIALLAGLIAAYAFFRPLGEVTASDGISIFLGFASAALAFFSIVATRYYESLADDERLPEAGGLLLWFRGGAWLMMVCAASLLLRGFKYPLYERYTAQFLVLLVFIVLFEMIVRAAGAFSARKQIEPEDVSVRTDFVCMRFFLAEKTPWASFFAVMESVFGVNLKSTWALQFVKQSLTPLLCLLVLVAWMFSALVMVDTSEEGILERFGKPVSEEPLGPGLHVTYPWPIDRVRRVQVTRVRTIPIGFTEAMENASLLWTKAHAVEEYNLLIGDGRDLVTVNAELHYRIKNTYNYLYNMQNPETAVEVIAYRTLMTETSGKSLDQVLSENIQSLVARMKEDIQAEADRKGLGIEVTGFTIKGLHPPIAVAPDYQAVVSAQVDRKTSIIRASAYKMETIPKAEAEALWTINNSLSNKATRLAGARGEAVQFKTLEESYKLSPKMFRTRKKLEGLEEALKLKRVFIIDDRLEKDGARMWLDARPQGKTPDF